MVQGIYDIGEHGRELKFTPKLTSHVIVFD